MVRRLLVAVALLGMLVMAAFALSPIYRGPLLLQLMAGAAAGSVGISVAARRLPGWSAAPLSVLGLAGVVVLTMRVSAAAAGSTAASRRCGRRCATASPGCCSR
ncbi:hypothetical protein [Dactylosporangium cerinum]